MKDNNLYSVSFENFRVFERQSELALAPITILTGANSSGKSSVIKALKLFQNFWKDLSENGTLDFSEGTHELGDFENILPYDSKKKEIIIIYKLKKHILFGELYIENVFKLDDSSDIKNGKLRKTSLYAQKSDEPTLLYEMKYKKDILQPEVETNIKEYFINKDVIINYYTRRLVEILRQRELFFDKCPRPHKSEGKKYIGNDIIDAESFGDYVGKARCYKAENYLNDENENEETNIYVEPVVNKELCDYLGVDFEIWKDIEENEGVSFLQGYPQRTERLLFQKSINNILNESVDTNKYNSKTLDLIIKIPVVDYDVYEEKLWIVFCEKYPEMSMEITRDKFQSTSLIVDEYVNQEILKYIREYSIYNELEANFNWRKLIKKYSESDFLTYFDKIEKEELNDISTPMKISNRIIDFNFQEKKAPTIESVILRAILFYSTSFDSRIFHTNNESVFDWNIENRIPFALDIQGEIERLSYTFIRYMSNNMYFIDAIRANVQRFYTFSSQGTSFNNILLKYLKQSRTLAEEKFIEKWIKEFEIGDSIRINRISSIGADIWIQKGDRETNLIDVGYGVTPFISLLLNIVSVTNEMAYRSKKDALLQDLNQSFNNIENIIVIEEPEINLHPKLQSKLVDFFWDAHKKFNVNFIIETHSEYLIRKLQYLTAKGDIETTDTVLHYIGNLEAEKQEMKGSQVKTIHIKPNGQLSHPFGEGFTDESSRWIKGMFILPNP